MALSGRQVSVLALALLLGMLDGYDALAMAFAAPAVGREWGLGKAVLGLLLSSGLTGIAFGSLVLSPLGDRVGRRPAVLGALALMTAGSLLSGFSGAPVSLFACRVLTGSGIGVMVAMTTLISAEFANARHRPLAVGVVATAGFPLDGAIGGLTASRRSRRQATGSAARAWCRSAWACRPAVDRCRQIARVPARGARLSHHRLVRGFRHLRDLQPRPPCDERRFRARRHASPPRLPADRSCSPVPGSRSAPGARDEHRRNFLSAAGASAGCASLLGSSLMAKAPAPRAGIIDIHHHIIPPALAGFIRPIPWTPQGAIEVMDRAGIAAAIASGGIDLGPDPSRHVALARNVNDYGATLVRDYPGRYGQFAALPLPDIAASLIEIDHALDQLHADGFGIATSYGDRWLGDQMFWPVWEKLNTRSAVVFVHPQEASCCTPNVMSYTRSPIKGPPIMGAYVEFPMNTARTIFSLMTSGTLRRFPHINWIFAHGGGVMPLLVQRLAGYVGSPTDASRQVYFPNGVAAEFATLHFECAQAFARANMNALRDLVPDSKIMFGSDFPSMPLDYVVKQFNDLELPTAMRATIARASAARLLPRWA